MKQNDGCALEQMVNGRWLPVALRRQRFTQAERLALYLGDTISRDGTNWRRHDWAARHALALALAPK